MYRYLEHDEHVENAIVDSGIFSITQDGGTVEKLSDFRTSRRTIIICSLLLITATGILATWIFLAKPHFYPATKVRLLKRSDAEWESNLELQAGHGVFVTNSGRTQRVRRESSKDSVVRVSEVIRVGPPGGHDKANNTGAHRGLAQAKNNGDDIGENDKSYDKTGGGQGTNAANPSAREAHVHVLTNPAEFSYNDSRLPIKIIPEEYFVSIDVDLEKDKFTGSVTMVLRCKIATDKLVFHGRDITIISVNVTTDDKLQLLRRVSYIKQWNMFVMEMQQHFQSDKVYRVHVEYEAKFGQSLAGLYRSKYRTKNGGER